VDIVPNTSYWDRTDVPGMGSIYFGHDIIFEEEKLMIQHTVRLEKDNPSEDDLKFLCGVFSDVPYAVMKIKEAVEN
jgi:hypothetical protein